MVASNGARAVGIGVSDATHPILPPMVAEAAGLYSWAIGPDGLTACLSTELRRCFGLDEDLRDVRALVTTLAPGDAGAVTRALRRALKGEQAEVRHDGPERAGERAKLRTLFIPAPSPGGGFMV